ncbi:MAG: hypothetical protein RR619_08805, partial [Raoultibacter sp.]
MGEQLTRRQWAGFDAFSLVCLVAFFSSIPFLLAPLDLIRSLLSDVSTTVLLEPFVATPFLAAITLAAMFTSLAMLFVCLLKTAYARLGQRLLIIAGVAYLIGMLTVSATAFVPDLPSALILTSGVLLGVGGALLCMAWAREVRLPDYRRALISLLMLGAGVFALDSGLLLLATAPRAIMLFLLAAVGTLGCLKCAFATNRNAGQPTTSGSNWWDVFGRLDMSLLEGGSDFGTPLTRTMFFIVTPAVVFLLFIAGMNMHHSTYEEFPVEFVGGIIALICAAPLLFVKGERASINTAYRFYLPILAVVVFVVGDFAPIDERGLLLNVGVYVFCFVYGLLLCAMI